MYFLVQCNFNFKALARNVHQVKYLVYLRCQISYEKLDKHLWCLDEESIFPYSSQNYMGLKNITGEMWVSIKYTSA